MKTAPPRPLGASLRQDGVALVIILAFLVLLTVLALAYFTRALTERQVSNSSAAQTKADILAHSAMYMILGDLKQEIVNGSTSTVASPTPIPPTPTVTIYTPTSNFNMIPQQSGTAALVSGSAPVPNLIRVSVRSDPMPTPGVPSRASAVNSTNDVSTNGRSVALARWNSHYLIPRLNVGGTTINTTPISAFTPPDWVMVTSQKGPDVLSTPTVDTSGSTVTVIGRYAYAIYNEGGLLDMNVAGYPSSVSVGQSSLKGPLSFADLTQIGLSNGGSAYQVDTILGWRNNATIQPSSGSVSGSYDFQGSPTTGTNYYNYVVSNTNGFLAANPIPYPSPATSTSRTDQMFSSRQALIKMMRAIGFSQDSLQYMGTFSRDLEQPSYVPNPNRTLVLTSTTNNAAYPGTGNDSFGTSGSNSSVDINPPFLSVRVASAFTRPDGTPANVGDPLVLKRFPLSRLGLIVSGTTATQSQNDPIYRNFGLYRTSGTGPWLYNHDPANTAGIDRLNAVSSQGREADFFELLKAAINVGSIGKASCYNGIYSWGNVNSAPYLWNLQDHTSNLQILQIGANIIDQAKADNFPTRIQFAGNSAYEVRGTEDLPYLYRLRNWIVRSGSTGSLAQMLFLPELWNPHSLGSSTNVPSTGTPTNFQFSVSTDVTSTASPLSITATYTSGTAVDISSSSPFNNGITPPPVTFQITGTNGSVFFREPNLLMIAGTPAGSSLSGTTFTEYQPNTPRLITGIFVDSCPWYYSGTTNALSKISPTHNVANSSLHCYLQYQDSSSNWITYDEQLIMPYNNASISEAVNIANSSLQLTASTDWYGSVRTDPRTSRWGIFMGQYMDAIPMVGGANSNSEFTSMRPDGGLSLGTHKGGEQDTGFVGTSNSYPKVYHGFQSGYWTENSVRATYQDPVNDPGDAGLRFTADPDGIVRRAMGGYWSDTSNGGYLVTNGTSPSPPVAGLPMATANYGSRPTILHRPFRSVAELGYVFRGTPWGNINFSFPESGDSALLDVFCINENSNTTGMVAGHVDLNTRQAPVLQALLSGVLLDKDDPTVPLLSGSQASSLATQLVARTSGTYPLVTRADLVGTWNFAGTAAQAKAAITSGTSDPNAYYTGFSHDIGTVSGVLGTPVALVPRQRESVMRALADSGSTRVWNLLIDIVAQSGKYPPNATVGPNTTNALANFVVEGEKRYWLHVAIDRVTGTIIDRQLELVPQ